MHTFIILAVSNAATAAVLAVLVAAIGWRLRRPALLHLLWVLVLVRLFAPPVLELSVLPPASTTTADRTAEVELLPVNPPSARLDTHGASPFEQAAMGMWISGSILAGLLILVRVGRFRRLLAAARPAGPELEARLQRVAASVGCRRIPKLVETPAQISPQLWSGLGRPVLVLPRRLMQRIGERQLDTIIAHELAHLRRGDHRVRWLELAAAAAYWWNPAVWWATQRLRQAEEVCCDAIVTEAFPGRVRDYAGALVESVRQLAPSPPRSLVAASRLARTASLERRIVTMFQMKPARPLNATTRMAVAAAALVAIGLTPILRAREASPLPQTTAAGRELSGEPITLELKDADIRDVLATFSKLTGLEILTEPLVRGTVTVEIRNQPWDQALDKLLRSKGFIYSIEGNRLIVRSGKPPAPALGRIGKPVTTEDEPAPATSEGGAVTAPKKIDGPQPAYPDAARKDGIEGIVVLDCLIGADGQVHDIKVLRPLPEGLTEAATEAVRQWRFEPATKDGRPIEARYVLTVRFTLDKTEEPQ